MKDTEKVKQPSLMPTRKVALGAANGAGALVGVNVLLMLWVGQVYGSADAVPQHVFNLLLWVNGIITVVWQTFAGWFVSEVRPRLAYAIEHALDDVLPLPPDPPESKP